MVGAVTGIEQLEFLGVGIEPAQLPMMIVAGDAGLVLAEFRQVLVPLPSHLGAYPHLAVGIEHGIVWVGGIRILALIGGNSRLHRAAQRAETHGNILTDSVVVPSPDLVTPGRIESVQCRDLERRCFMGLWIQGQQPVVAQIHPIDWAIGKQ